tara:strand:- start:26760 stop:26933 length:174 start_codon:yes stop_codon:yes gene_type:complete
MKNIYSEVLCPKCGKKNNWSKSNRWRPFCCERCKMIDLGEWFNEEKRIIDRKTTDDE